MKNRFHHIALFFFMCSFAVTFGQSIDIKKIKDQLPKLLGANNIGTEFVFGFHPCWEESSQNNAIRIYVSSPVETEVRLTIPYFSDEPFQVRRTKPNDIIEFILAPGAAQPYSRGIGGTVQTLMPTQIFKGRGIILESDAPVVVYGVTRYMYTSDGFLALPVHALGNEYTISSYRETADFKSQSLTPYADIIGVYPKTKVSFFFGGNNNSRIRTTDERIWKPFEVLRAELNRGDFWLIASEQASSDLGGSFVIASQPVSVLSGNHCAYVPSQLAACDFIIEQELPTNTWGTKYYVSPIVDRAKASMIRVFCKDGPTTVYRDGVEQFTLFTNWGLQEEAWSELRANPDTNKAEVYHSDKPIYVVQYNTGQQDDGVLSDPFQLVLTPIEQFQKDILFNTPGIRGGFGFQRNYINIIYQSDNNNSIPDDLELGEIMVTGETVWKKIKDISSSPGQQFDDQDFRGSNIKMFSKTIKLPYDAVYKLRAKNQDIAAYAYGFASYDSYGFPTSMAVIDLGKNDSLPPIPYFELTCQGNTIDKKTYVMEAPQNDTSRSNLAVILFDRKNSFNYEFSLDRFVAGESYYARWGLKVIDPTQDARAFITFADRRGNDTTLLVEYFAVKLSISPKNYYFGNFKIGEEKSQQFTLRNDSETSAAYLNELTLKTLKENLAEKGFTLFYAFDINEPILPKDTRSFFITFTAQEGGEFRDSIGLGDTCFFRFRTLVRAIVGIPVIQVSDVDFGNVTVGSSNNLRTVTITNLGTTAININGFRDKTLKEYTHNLPKIDEDNPVIIEKGGQYQFDLTFAPSTTGTYPDSIIFDSDAGSNIDPVCIIKGAAIEPQLEANGDDWGRKRAHLERYDTISNYKFIPYPAPNGAIVFKNDGTKEVTLKKINILKNINGEAFEILVNGKLEPLVNYINNLGMILDENNQSINVIQAGSSVHLPIFFHPRTHGEHTLKIEYESDAPKRAVSLLTGIGIYPKLNTFSLNFGSRIIGEPPFGKSVKITNQLWEFQDSVTIQSLYCLPAGSIYPDLTQVGTEGFAYDGDNLHFSDGDSAQFPFVLQPGDYIEIDGEFSAVKVGNAMADLITNSDAFEEADSYWVGFGILEKLKVYGPEEEYYCFDPNKEFVTKIINDGTIGVPMPVNSLTLQNNPDNSFIIDRVERSDKSLIDFINGFTIIPGDTISVIVKYVPSVKPQPNVEEIHSCTLRIQTNSVIPESRIFTVPIKLRTIRYTRQSESVINGADEITIDPGTNIDVEPINYSIFIHQGSELEMANPLDFHITISYRKNFIGINQLDGVHKIYPGTGLTKDWTIAGYKIEYNEATLIETVKVHLKGKTPFKSNKRLELLRMEFLVFLPWHKPHDTTSRERIVTIFHEIKSELACLDFVNPENVIAKLKETCAFEYRTITISDKDYFLSTIQPNPVSESGTEITFGIPFNDFVEISICNSLGEVVERLISKRIKAGSYSLRLPIEKLPSGVYFIEMISGEVKETRKFNVNK